ncbi:hypothetical protein XELAEV_18000001mg [Xenopus laevis]|uniref:Fish-egg lectin-like n=1 Tax=Xenopus laevis TaxID=8355 RepID=A0A974GZF6_XENLA|nr:hypothetical protein XELAEV_18000001mg [Xenopus laevis]
MSCTVMPGKLKQLDAGKGEVFGVSEDDKVYFWHLNQWTQIAGNGSHVTVGPAGIWVVNKFNLIYRLQNFEWIRVSGLFKQIDAGGDTFLAGVNTEDNIYCLNQDKLTETAVTFTQIEGKLMYYSCGPLGCWGVNNVYEIYYQKNVTQTSCKGTRSVRVSGSLVMVEVGTDGSVFGVNQYGKVFRSYDAGFLWIIAENGRVIRCP